jgi:hypothetical protein
MAFLDNSGDIILDAVLTDTGRMRLAKGDGSFNITKFALGDDEINYAIYDKNHASGSAYYDLEILQTPILEAFTNNASSMKSQLITISRTNHLYLPVVLRNTNVGIANSGSTGVVAVYVDQSTAEDANVGNAGTSTKNSNWAYIDSYNMTANTEPITFDQGIQSDGIGSGDTTTLDADLIETQFIIEMDNRLGRLFASDGLTRAIPSFVDDDNIASYYLSTTTNPEFFGNAGTQMSNTPIQGPRGNRLQFLIGPSVELNSSTYLFTQIGGASNILGTDLYHIDANVRVIGATTGYHVDMAVRYMKKQ